MAISRLCVGAEPKALATRTREGDTAAVRWPADYNASGVLILSSATGADPARWRHGLRLSAEGRLRSSRVLCFKRVALHCDVRLKSNPKRTLASKRLLTTFGRTEPDDDWLRSTLNCPSIPELIYGSLRMHTSRSCCYRDKTDLLFRVACVLGKLDDIVNDITLQTGPMTGWQYAGGGQPALPRRRSWRERVQAARTPLPAAA
jgi:hypothetical protein